MNIVTELNATVTQGQYSDECTSMFDAVERLAAADAIMLKEPTHIA